MHSIVQFLFLFIFLIALIAPVRALQLNTSTIKHEFYNEFLLDFTNQTSRIDQILRQINDHSIELIDLPWTSQASTCLKCRTFVHAVIEFSDRPQSRDENAGQLRSVLRALCTKLTPLTPGECDGYAGVYLPTIDYILTHRKTRHPDFADGACAILYQNSRCGTSGYTIPMNLSIGVGPSVLRDSKRYFRDSDPHNLTLLHLTDFHYDPLYAPGSPSDCAESICCRNSSTARVSPDGALPARAGHWGDYAVCDSPGHLIENVCQQIAAQHPHIDFIYYTGDFIDHFEWLTTKQGVRDSVAFVTDVMRRAFPGVVIVPQVGNHDVHPSNAFAPESITDPELSMKWLNEFIADQWADWLPEDARRSLREVGYFSTELRPGLRVISVNSNVCYVKNLWLLFETDSLRVQLSWLHDTLAAAELAGERVHLLGHVPANDVFCLNAWNVEYMRIVRRFAHIISGQFYGHTHQDEFSIVYEGSPSTAALNVAWTGGSATSFVGLNSNYRLYYLDSGYYYVLDHDTWIFNLTEANSAPADHKPRWFKEYSFRDEYNVSSLSPAVLGEVANGQWTENVPIQRLLWQNKVKRSDKLLAEGCDDACLYDVLCVIFMCPA